MTGSILAAGLFLAGLAWACVSDARTREIPDGVHLLLVLAALIQLLAGEGPSWRARLAGALCVSVPMLLLALIVDGAFGGGDIKLTAAAGCFLGWRGVLTGTFLAVLGGGLWGALLLLRKKAGRKDQFAFGPFLCAGLAAALFWGEPLLNWYLEALWAR